MKQKHLPRLLSLLLLVATLISTLAISASAATLGDSNSVTVKSKGREEYLSKSTGGTIGSGLWTFTSNDGLTGTAYCVNWGLTGVSPNKALTLQPYNRNPKTMGAFSNGYPQRTLEQFKEINEGSIRGLADLTEDEYQYATQIAVWATCGQLSVPGTTFTAGRAALVEPTSDAQEIRIYDSVKAILAKTGGWDQHFYPGMYLRAEEDRDVRGVEIINELGLAGAADDGDEGIQKETINGVEYYTRVLYVASATSTWIDGYTTKVYSTDAPQGTIFTAENGSALETVQENGTTYYKVDTSASRNTNLNANGQEYYGAFKVCIPVASAADEGSFTIKATGGIAQFNLFLAYNPSATEQSYIVADPAYTTGNASMPFKWSYTGQTGPASLQVVKTDGAGAPLEGAEFTLSGSGGTVVTGTSDRNGQIIWRDLPAEEVYTLVEDRAPEGYRIVEPMNITLTAGQTAYVTVKNHVENSFKLKKIDAQNKGSLQGAVFVFEQIDGTYKTTGITGFDGVIEFVGDELPYGSYRVTEQSSSPGYVKSDRVETIAWDGTKDVTIVWENTRDISLTIVKVDEQSGISLPNATFDVYADGEYFTSVTTNDAGEAYVSGIKKEAYIEVVETASPQGYVLDRTSHGIHIDPYDPATEEDPVLVVTNRARPALRIVKYDAQSMQPLADTTFEVYHDGNLLGEYTTDYNGEIFLYDLDPGTYLIKEIATKDSHVVNSTPQQIELKAGATSTYSVVFLNYLKPGMHLVKLDSQSMKPLPNVRFRISQVGGDFSKEFVTDINGEIDLSALEPSAYLVEELEAPDGYLIDDASRVIQLEPGVNAQFVFTNTREPSLRLIKRSSDGTPLEGVTFRIARIEDGSRYLDRVTDENGEINMELSHNWYAKALNAFRTVDEAKSGRYVEYRVGKMYAAGLGTEQDQREAAEWFARSAGEGYKYAQYSLAGLHLRGMGVPQDYEQAHNLYTQAARQQFPYAAFELGKLYRDGLGCDVDPSAAARWFKEAYAGFRSLERDSHDDKLQYRIGWMLLHSVGAEKNESEARTWFEKAARMGNPNAQYSLAKLILSDPAAGAEQTAEAIDWLTKAAEAGQDSAQYAIGKFYRDTDPAKAAVWFQRSAESGNDFAAYALGKLLLQGEAVPKDIDQALRWLTASAKQGNQYAQYTLGKLYLLGKEVPGDEDAAVRWFTLSAAQGNEYARYFLDHLKDFRGPSLFSCATQLLRHMGNIFREQTPWNAGKGVTITDRKLRQKIREKKIAMGHKADDHAQEMTM